MQRSFDVVIVGAGPVGLACAIAARKTGLDHLVLERGCVVNSVFRFPVNMTFFTTPDLLEIGNHPFVTCHQKPTRHEALEYYRSVARVERLSVRTRERVAGVEGTVDGFRILTAGREGPGVFESRRVILATGYYDNPNFLGVPGEDLPHVSHYYTEPHPFAGERVLVVGGRNSACEAALDLMRHDAHVTLVHRGERLGGSVKYWVRPDMENRIRDGEIRALFNTRVAEIGARSVVLEATDGSRAREESFDQVFLLTGYHPDIELLANCGLQPDPDTLLVPLDPETLESREIPGIHLAGSVGAGRETGTVFIENGRDDCESIFRHLARSLSK